VRLWRSRTSPQLTQGWRGLEHCSQAARAVPGQRHCRSFPQIVQVSTLALSEQGLQIAFSLPWN